MVFTINSIDQLKPILKGYRKSRKLSQTQLANKLGITQQAYQVLESNPKKVTVGRLFRVFTILGVKIQLLENDHKQSELDISALCEIQWVIKFYTSSLNF